MSESRDGIGIETKSQSGESGYYRWAEPNSDITVCLNTESLEMDALRGIVSSSCGGNETGGILLGRTGTNNAGALTYVDDFVPVLRFDRRGSPANPFPKNPA